MTDIISQEFDREMFVDSSWTLLRSLNFFLGSF